MYRIPVLVLVLAVALAGCPAPPTIGHADTPTDTVVPGEIGPPAIPGGGVAVSGVLTLDASIAGTPRVDALKPADGVVPLGAPPDGAEPPDAGFRGGLNLATVDVDETGAWAAEVPIGSGRIIFVAYADVLADGMSEDDVQLGSSLVEVGAEPITGVVMEPPQDGRAPALSGVAGAAPPTDAAPTAGIDPAPAAPAPAAPVEPVPAAVSPAAVSPAAVSPAAPAEPEPPAATATPASSTAPEAAEPTPAP